jgi:hypothetical protein
MASGPQRSSRLQSRGSPDHGHPLTKSRSMILVNDPAAEEVAGLMPRILWFVLVLVAAGTLAIFVGMWHSCKAHQEAVHWSLDTLSSVRSTLKQIDAELDHVQALKTDMSYLREQQQREERRRRRVLTEDIFAYQDAEVMRAADWIGVLKKRLRDVDITAAAGGEACAAAGEGGAAAGGGTAGKCDGRASAVHVDTVLSCDWLDATNQTFEWESPVATVERRRGCHVPVPARREREREQTTFGCFDDAGQPQGCHVYAKQKVAELLYTTGCATGNLVDWGWCGRWPWSSLWWGKEATHEAGCTTLQDALIALWDSCSGYSYTVYTLGAGALSILVYGRRSYREMTSVLTDVRQSSRRLLERQDGTHGQKFVERVSLQLNILGSAQGSQHAGGGTASPAVDRGDTRPPLYLRTLWEKNLQEIIPDPRVRELFRAAADASTAEKPFLCGGEAGLVKNLFMNAISAICSSNFVLQDFGLVCKVESFIFGITFEENWDPKPTSDHVHKIRVLLIRESKLNDLSKLTEEGVRFQSDSEHHKMRFRHLQDLGGAWVEEHASDQQRRARKAQLSEQLAELSCDGHLLKLGNVVGARAYVFVGLQLSKPDIDSNWENRWFQLDGPTGLLTYYKEQEGERDYKGSIDMRKVESVECCPYEKRGIVIKTPNITGRRKWRLRAENEVGRDNWVGAVQAVVDGVKELDELGEETPRRYVGKLTMCVPATSDGR